MRKCCIDGCSSERNLFEYNILVFWLFAPVTNSLIKSFRITVARKEWINIIKQHQSINENHKLYICDLHFNPEDIKVKNSKTSLLKNAVPHIKYVSYNKKVHSFIGFVSNFHDNSSIVSRVMVV